MRKSWKITFGFTVALAIDSAIASDLPIRHAYEPVKDMYIVEFTDAVPTAQIATLANQLASKNRGQVTALYTLALKGFAVKLNAQQAELLNREPIVRSMEEDGLVHLSQSEPDPQAATTSGWQLDRLDQHPILTTPGPHYVYSWHVSTSGAGVDAYVLDTGVWPQHQELSGAGKVDTGVNFATDCTVLGPGNDPFCSNPLDLDKAGHGTAVASALGGATVGVAKNVRIVPVRTHDAGGNSYTSWEISGINWIMAQRDNQHPLRPAVANMSFYEYQFKAPGSADISKLDEAVDNLIAKGGVFVAASANNFRNYGDGYDACDLSPSRIPRVVTVGGTDRNDQVWVGSDDIKPGWKAGSNTGPCVDIFAPAEYVKVADIRAANAYRTGELSSGTSFASPQVAGIAATYLQADTTATPATIWAFLQSSSTIGVLTIPSQYCDAAHWDTLHQQCSNWIAETVPNRFSYSNLVPMDNVTPTSSDAGAGGATVTVTGGNFQLNAAFKFADTLLPITIQNATQFTFTRPSPLSAGTLYPLTFINYNSTDGDSVLSRGYLADFTDVPQANAFHPYVVALGRNKVTLGCGSGSFCASSSVTRAQLALFMLRAMHGGSFEVQVPHNCAFTDMSGATCYSVSFLVNQDSIMSECAAGEFCPNTYVLRNQSAQYLLQARHGYNYVPNPNVAQTFGDVPPSDPYYAWIEQLYADGLTEGCGTDPNLTPNLIYCPTANLTRLQMAKMVAGTFGLQ